MNSIEDVVNMVATEATETLLENKVPSVGSNGEAEKLQYKLQVVVGEDGKPVLVED